MTEVRIARAADAASMLEIYKPYILASAYTFESEVPSVKEFELRIEKYLEKYPWILSYINGEIAGYAYASGHRGTGCIPMDL